MMYELIRSFAHDNFGSDYHVAPQGHNKAIQPLALIAKENLSCWSKATTRPRKIVLERLDVYLTNDETVRSKVIPVIEGNLQKDKILTVNSGTSVSTSEQIELELGEAVVGHAGRKILLGELNLSSVQEEYYKDMSLRTILSSAKLDPTKMEPYEKNKLYIITGVVYSERLHVDGKRQENDDYSAQVKFLPRVQWISRLTQLKAGISRTENPAPPVERNERSPLLFTFAKVKYNQEKACLELQQLVGAKLKPRTMLDVVADSVADSLCPQEILVTTKEQWIYEDLMESSENKTEKKLQVVTSFLKETKDLNEWNLRTRKYLNLVNGIMKNEKMVFRTECPFSAQDSSLLQATGVEIQHLSLNNSKLLRITAHNRSMVLEFAQIFYHLHEIRDEEWTLLKAFSENPKDMEDGKDFTSNGTDKEKHEDKDEKEINEEDEGKNEDVKEVEENEEIEKAVEETQAKEKKSNGVEEEIQNPEELRVNPKDTEDGKDFTRENGTDEEKHEDKDEKEVNKEGEEKNEDVKAVKEKEEIEKAEEKNNNGIEKDIQNPKEELKI